METMEAIFKCVAGLRSLLKVAGAAALAGMMLLTCADVIGRYLGKPIFGSVEIVGFLATLTAALALPYAHAMKSHIGVEILVQKLSPKLQTAIELCTNTVALAFFGIVTWRMYVYANTFRESGEVSMNLEFPEHVIIYLTALCFLIFALTILEDIVKALKLVLEK